MDKAAGLKDSLKNDSKTVVAAIDGAEVTNGKTNMTHELAKSEQQSTFPLPNRSHSRPDTGPATIEVNP